MVGGTGSGKTWFAPIWLHKKLTENPGWRCLCIGMGYEHHVANVMMHECMKHLTRIGEKFEVNRKSGTIRMTNGSQLLFGSAENPESLEGVHLECAWIDEAGMMPRLAWDVAQRRTGRVDGPILITTVPYFEGWLKKEVYDAWVKGDPDIDWIPCKSKDNPTYSLKEIERMRRNMRPEKFEIFYEGKWARASGLIFPDPRDEELLVEPFDIPDEWPQFAGHDWGMNAPTTGMWGRLSPDDVLYLVAEYEENEMSVDQHIDNWTHMGLLQTDEAWGDPANPEQWLRAGELGYAVTKGNNAVLGGIDAVYSRLVTGRLKVFKGLKQWIDHRATYRWATAPHDEEVLLDKPLKPQPAEHLMDATRYLCMGLEESAVNRVSEPLASTRRRQMIGA